MIFSQLGQDDSIHSKELVESCQQWEMEERKSDGTFHSYHISPTGTCRFGLR